MQYGSAAVGGVVNVITKKGKSKPTAALQYRIGSFDYREESLSASGLAGPFDFALSLARSNMGDYETGDDEEYHNTGYDDELNAGANLGWNFADNHRLSLHYTGYEVADSGNPGKSRRLIWMTMLKKIIGL